MRVALFGLGYVGCVTAACLAEQGHVLVGVDKSADKVATLSSGRSPILEPGLDDLLTRAASEGKITATTEAGVALKDADIIMVCVGTPSRPNGSLDLTYLLAVTEEIGAGLEHAAARPTIIIRSTMLPGTLRNEVLPLLEATSGRTSGVDFELVHCPEFLRETTAIEDFYNPPFSVVGTLDDGGGAAVKEMLSFLSAPLHETAAETAESLKYTCNAFHALKVVFTNEVARVLDGVGVDARPVMELFVQDRDLNLSPRYLRPGFAFGGSCLPKDVRAFSYLGRDSEQNVPMLTSLLPSNDVHIRRAVSRILATEQPVVALLGLSFKTGTDDVRESPYIDVVEGLLAKGVEVRIFDPSLNPQGLVGSNKTFALERLPHLARLLVDDVSTALTGAGCVVLGTQGRAALDAVRAAQPAHVLDLAGGLRPEEEQSLRDTLTGVYSGVAW